MAATSAEAISTIGARMIEMAHKASGPSNDTYHNAYAHGIARGLAESIVHIVLGKHTQVRPEYVEAVVEWASRQPDAGHLALNPTDVRAVRRCISDAISARERTTW